MRIFLLPTLALLLFACSGNETKPAPDTLAGPRRLPRFFFLDSLSPSGDSTFLTVAPHKFLAHTGDTFRSEMLNDKVYVADFFFANCQGICPKMTKQLTRVQDQFRNNQKVMIVSYTVDPERDHAEALAAYAKEFGVEKDKWLLLTGEKKELYELARQSYKVTATEGDGGPDDFVHSELLVLVDPNKNIRGYYDGTDSVQVNALIDDIGLLLQEFKSAKK